MKKGHFEDLYEYASAQARAIVLRSRIENGIEEIYVDWDRDHWRTNHEENMWTFANHFDVLEEPELGEYVEPFTDTDEYLDSLEGAMSMASEGEGFLVLSLKRDLNDGELFPQVMIRTQSEEAKLIFDREILPSLGFDDE